MKDTNEEQEAFDRETDELRAENAFLKLKLEMDHGMLISELKEIDPVLEHRFLSQILDFEQKFKACRVITMYEFLDFPKFRRRSSLTADEISIELKRLEDLMASKNIFVERPPDFSDAQVYTFITEVFFVQETNDFMANGMAMHFQICKTEG